MSRFSRVLLIVIAAAEVLLGVAYLFQMPFAVALWPWPAMSPLSFLLLGSLFVTIATGTLWPILMREDGFAAALGLVYIAALVPLTIFGFQSAAREGVPGMAIFAVVCLLGVLFGAWLLMWARAIPIRDPRRTPRVALAAFGLFLAALIFFGGQMAMGRTILPWNITPQLSVIFGWVFLAGGALFAIGLLRREWILGAGILASFLIYDLVLIGPFLQRLATVAPQHRTNLIIYIVALVISGSLAIYYLFLNPQTRLWHRQPG